MLRWAPRWKHLRKRRSPRWARGRERQRKRRSLRGRKSGGPQGRSPGRSGRRTRSVRKPKSQPRNPQRRRPRRRKPRKRRQRKRSAEVKRKLPDEGPEVFLLSSFGRRTRISAEVVLFGGGS